MWFSYLVSVGKHCSSNHRTSILFSFTNLHGGEQALPLRAHRPGAGPGGLGSLLDGCRGASGVCHFLYNGGADGEHWDSLEHVPVLPTGEEKKKIKNAKMHSANSL